MSKCDYNFEYTLCIFSINGADVTFTGNGLIDVEAKNNNSYGINVVNGGSVTILNGTYTGATSAVQAQNGIIKIYGGTFKQAKTIAEVYPQYAKYVINAHDNAYEEKKATIDILGGTFIGFNPTDNPEGAGTSYVVGECDVDETTNEIVVTAPTRQSDEHVAVTNGIYFKELSNALSAAPVGGTVTLLKDYDPDTNVIEVNGEIVTLDLGGNILTAQINVARSELTIKNGTIESPLSDAYLDGGAAVYVLACDDTSAAADDCVLNVESTALLHGYYGILVSGPTYSSNAAYGATINVEGTVHGPIFVAGNIGNTAELHNGSELVTINIENGAYLDGNQGKGGKSAAIVQSGETVLNIYDGARLEGTEAVAMKRGSLNIEGGTFIGNGDKIDPAVANNNGSENTGSAISVTSTYAKDFNVLDINISGGTFKSVNNAAVYVGHSANNNAPVGYKCNIVLDISEGTFISADDVDAVYIADKIDTDTGISTTDKVAEKFISDGSFSSSVAEHVTDDLKFELNNNGTYSYYRTAEEALANAEPGAVINGIGDQAAVNVYSLKVVYGNGQADYSVKVTDGTKYTLPTVSKPGYIFMGWKCSDAHTHQPGEAIEVTKNMTFTAIWANMPDITPGTPGTPDDDDEPVVTFPFTDVREGQWFYEAVKYVYDEGIMNGMDRYTFDPNGSLTRAMVWTMLARHEGVDTEGGANWYAKAQDWAVEAGVSDGTDPMGNITREQLVTMLWRLNGSEVVTGSLTGFTDCDKVSDWAGNAMLWATVNGIIEADEANALNPTAGCTRAQAAAMIMRFCAYHEADSFGTVV